MTLQKFSTNSVFEKEMAFSRAVEIDGIVYVSGCTGYNYKTGIISENIEDQTHQTFQNLIEALKGVGSSLEEVVKVTYYVPDHEDFVKTWPILRHYFFEIMPACTALSSKLVNEKLKIEIEVISHKSKTIKA